MNIKLDKGGLALPDYRASHFLKKNYEEGKDIHVSTDNVIMALQMGILTGEINPESIDLVVDGLSIEINKKAQLSKNANNCDSLRWRSDTELEILTYQISGNNFWD